MGFSFGEIKTTEKNTAIKRVVKDNVDMYLLEQFNDYLSKISNRNKESYHFESAILGYKQYMENINAGNISRARMLYHDSYMFNFEVKDGKVDVYMNARCQPFHQIGFLDFISDTPVPIRSISKIQNLHDQQFEEPMDEETYNTFWMTYQGKRYHKLDEILINTKKKKLPEVKEFPLLFSRTAKFCMLPKTIDAFNNLLKTTIETSTHLKVAIADYNVQAYNNMYMNTGDREIFIKGERVAKKNSNIIMQDYIESDNIKELVSSNIRYYVSMTSY